MLFLAYALLITLLFFLGAALASFFYVVALRLPAARSPLTGRSACPSCKHTLSAPDIVPVISFFALSRRCRYCGARIPWRYVLAEAAGGVAAALLYVSFGLKEGLFFLIVFQVLACISLIDHKNKLIPDGLNFALLLLGVLSLALGLQEVSFLARVIGFASVSAFLLFITLIIPGAFGGGDIKLMAAAGFLLGWKNTLLAFFIGILLGGIYAASLIIRKKAGPKAHMDFGPCLCAGIYAALLFGERFIAWYFALFWR